MALDDFLDGEREAWEKGVLEPPADALTPALAKSWRGHYLAATADQLFLLGYLERPSTRLSAVEAALALYRQEAGIEDTGEIGHELVASLEALTRIEVAEGPAHDPEALPEPLRYRLAALRLFLYGLLPGRLPPKPVRGSRPGRADPYAQTDAAVGRFNVCLMMLGHVADGLVPRPDGESFRLLMDHDRLVAFLATLDDSFRARTADAPSHRGRTDIKRLVDGFLARAMEVELWLQGYLANPYQRLIKDPDRPVSIGTALQDFWQGQPAEVRPADWGTQGLPEAFFRRVAVLSAASGAAGRVEAQDDQAFESGLQALAGNRNGFADLSKAVRRSLLGRIWDGIKRAWGAIWNFFRGLFRAANRVFKLIVRNIARVVGTVVPAVYARVRLVTGAFRAGIGFVFSAHPAFMDQVPGLYVRKHVDGDMDSYIPASADAATLRAVYARMALAARAFGLSANLLVDVISAVVKLAAMNWLSVVIAITRFGLHWREHADRLVRLTHLGEALADLDARLSAPA